MLKSKTFWTGVLAVGTAIVAAVFADDGSVRAVMDIATDVLNDPRFLAGMGMIFMRQAVAKAQPKE